MSATSKQKPHELVQVMRLYRKMADEDKVMQRIKARYASAINKRLNILKRNVWEMFRRKRRLKFRRLCAELGVPIEHPSTKGPM